MPQGDILGPHIFLNYVNDRLEAAIGKTKSRNMLFVFWTTNDKKVSNSIFREAIRTGNTTNLFRHTAIWTLRGLWI